MDYSNFERDYKNIISSYKINKNIKEHKIFEYLWALKNKMILWDDLPPGFDEIYDLPHQLDYGIDLISLTYDKTGQVKYHKSSKITWNMMTNYTTYSCDLLGIDNMILSTTKEAEIDKMVQKLLDKKNVSIQRDDFEKLLSDIQENDIIEEKESFEIEQRDYLVECSEIFREGENDIYKFQLPCGMGKSFIIMDIVKKSEGQHIVFVPWIDLARQFEKDCLKFGISTSFIGDGEERLDEDCDLLICVYNSCVKIPDWDFTYKFLDEAHHLEDESSVLRQKIDEINCEKTLLLSATFKENEELDYEMTLRDGIEKGYLSDYVLNIEYFSDGDKKKGLLNMIKNNLAWAPMFIYFNTTKTAIDFSKELTKIGVSSNYLIGKDGKNKRTKIIKALKKNQLQVLCLCGCFNEGISINNLKTVIFGDLRFSDINRIQISLRANRPHPDKPFFRIVLPIIEDDFSDDKIADMMNTFFKIDPKIKESLKKGTKTRIRVKKDGKEYDEEAIIKREEIFNSLGEMIKGLTPLEKVDELLKWVEENNAVPPRNKTILFSNGSSMGSFWQNCKSFKKLDNEPYNLLLNNPVLKDNYDKYLINKDNKLTLELKVQDLLKWVEENKDVPPINKTILFSNGSCMGKFWQNCKSFKKLDNEPYNLLINNPILKDNYDKYLINIDNTLTPEQKVQDLLKWVEENNAVPPRNKTILFSDGSCMGSFWQSCKSIHRLKNEPYQLLLNNPILKDNYDEYLINIDNNTTPEQKVQDLLKWVEENDAVPPTNKTILFSNGSCMGKFWQTCKSEQKLEKEPYNLLLNNLVLKDNYDKYLINIDNTLTPEQKVQDLLKWVEENNAVPPRNKTILFSDGSCMGKFWQSCKSIHRLKNEPYQLLLNNPILKDNYDKYLNKKKN